MKRQRPIGSKWGDDEDQTPRPSRSKWAQDDEEQAVPVTASLPVAGPASLEPPATNGADKTTESGDGVEAAGDGAEGEQGSALHNPLLHGCREVDSFERLNKIDEGTYGVVFRARDRETGRVVALKRVKVHKAQARGGFPITALRETNVLLALRHENIVGVREMAVEILSDAPMKVYMVMDYWDHELKALMEAMPQPFSQSEVKCLMAQLLSAVAYMHKHWFIHRDLKTSNLLYNGYGRLAVCDFGLARKYDAPIGRYTPLVVTLHYRAPELLLGAPTYDTALDMWSVGCIFGELLLKRTLLPGKGELDQLDRIFRLLGTPTEERWPGFMNLPKARSVRWKTQTRNKFRELLPKTSVISGPYLSDVGFDLATRQLEFNPERRISAQDALSHAWFQEFPKAKAQEMMPTFASVNQRARKR